MTFPRLRLAVLGVCLCLPQVGLAQENSAWQPYRDLKASPLPDEVVEVVTTDVPIDALSDVELDVLCQPCQTECVAPASCHAPYGDPVLAPLASSDCWQWHLLPSDVIWHSYLAGAKEPRISGTWFSETQDSEALLDVTLGGRSSILRYGTFRPGHSEGWELQIEGAAILRLNLDNNWDFDLSDYRFGVPIIYGRDNQQWKFAYYHLSSHLGDELAIREGNLADRINYSRDALVVGYSLFPIDAVRVYAEAGYAFYNDGGSEPWEFQFGVDIAQPGYTGMRGTPYFAVNGHIREELDYGGNLSTQLGWLWRGHSGKVIRTGLHYYNGKSPQFQTFDEFEQQIGIGLWYDY